MVLFRVGRSTWRLMHEDGDHAEQEDDVRELRHDFGKASRGVQTYMLALAVLAPAGALLFTKSTGMATAADKADSTALVTITGPLAMSIMSLFLHSMNCRLIARDMGRLKKGM